MTETTPHPATTDALDAPGTGHRHTTRCWWDHERPGWVCPPAAPPPAPDAPLVDVRDMVVVHTALLREFRLAPAAVLRVAPDDRRRARVVERHLGLLCDLLHHHHAGEDALLWPLLRERVPARALTLLAEAEAQHAGLDEALGRVGATRRRWVDRPDAGHRDELAGTLRELHRQLAEHLDTEERTLLPLAAAHLTEPEWRAVGEHGAGAVPKSALPLVFGMFAYEGDPDVLASMLASAPALPRAVVPRIAPRVYARHAARVHGTPRP
ncbi:hemerythrin domain-containing protein [Actinomycetospora sp. TBRC 11914]|uniref:hemerythrin domain-containing protein n=1 Tax=Actinomycetospora sp. TBRC 11914 TaxID=2729387 RepID=UPI00145E6E20|nr:hemerythrin domain-containing protein [Actinomycetospora sp. TBRC 11914]NMO89964.1 hemerythrin domain-containing protein [Actinomycetospora sp. TBRC 11914]